MPARDRKREVKLQDSQDSRPWHEVHVPRRLPDPRAADEAKRRGEAAVDAVQRDEVVEEIVRVVGRDPPREGSPGHPRRLAARDPDLGLEVGSVDDEREVDVQPARALDALAARSGVERPDGADVGPGEEVVLDTHDGVVGVVASAGLRIEEADLPRPEPPVHSATGQDGYRRTARVETYAARIEQLHPARRPQVE